MPGKRLTFLPVNIRLTLIFERLKELYRFLVVLATYMVYRYLNIRFQLENRWEASSTATPVPIMTSRTEI